MALLIVLGVLTVLSLTAMMFSLFASVERTTAQVSIGKVQADLLADSALEHTASVLRQDLADQPAWDDGSEPWSTVFAPVNGSEDGNVDIDGLPGALPGQSAADARWMYVKDANARLVGRYAVLPQDEAAKINVNIAAALAPQMQNQGVGTFEVMLTDGRERGLPVSLPFGKNILRYRYGRDYYPGAGSVDDNLTASSYASDGIDNNANGIIDEPGEGIDEQEEYDPLRPRWDDRAFSSLNEVADLCAGDQPLGMPARRALKRLATVCSRSRDTFWDERSAAWRRQVNINIASRNQVLSLMRRANEEERYEPSSKNMRILVANVLDYRDENHVLTTFGSDYGVEAVCFNEVLANDGSYTARTDTNDAGWNEFERCYRYGYWYETTYGGASNGWSLESVGPREAGGSVVTNGVSAHLPHAARVRLNKQPHKVDDPAMFRRFREIVDQSGGWPADLWKNAWLMVLDYFERRGYVDYPVYRAYPIIANSSDELTVGVDDSAENTHDFLRETLTATNRPNFVRINNLWRRAEKNRGIRGMVCVFPQMSEKFCFPLQIYPNIKPPRNLYYRVFIGEQNFPQISGNSIGVTYVMNTYERPLPESATPWKGYTPAMDVDGDPSRYSETRMLELKRADVKGTTLEFPQGLQTVPLLRTPYQDGDPIRARGDFMHVTVTTAKGTGYDGGMGRVSDIAAYLRKKTFLMAYMMRPDIIELMNISDRPISMRNWKVVINTGSYADQVGVIDSAREYNPVRHGRYDNPNPEIGAGGYFYLTNNRDIFDREHGSPKDGRWGTSSSERHPCFELPDELWGVRYRVLSTEGGRMKCEGARWRRDQMKYELCEWHQRTPRSDQNSPIGIRITVEGNTSTTLDFGGGIESARPGDDVVILGMPREGGFLSMTLKNEYDQITARTVNYGSTDPDEIGYSTEKFDPTHYTWVKSRVPTFGGTARKAQNHSFANATYVKPYVKDNRFVNIAELQKVRTAQDWQNIGLQGRGRSSTKVLKAIGKYFTVSGVRLDPEEKDAHLAGWKQAYGTARFGGRDGVTAYSASWEPNRWAGQRLRLLSGEQRGEQFVITKSTEAGINVAGYSTPGQKQLRVREGDLFSVGPGYTTPFFYTTKEGDEGVWEWANKGIEPARYGLYLFGLNDSILTTEFLEENHNAPLDADVYNYVTRQFDRLPLPRHTATDVDDPYRLVPTSSRLQYDKSDGVYCGDITPEHISASGGLKLRLTAHNLNDKHCSGIAWFDYLCLAPAYVGGKINVNTASERVLTALSGVSPDIARAIFHGTDSSGRATLKPYRNVTSLLDVKGMTADLFGRICNEVTTRSDQFRLLIVAQALQDLDRDGVFNEAAGDRILAHAARDVVVDRSPLTDADTREARFTVSIRE